jgi:PAS domain S-box-containing protein
VDLPRVLLVDDNESLLHVADKFLQREEPPFDVVTTVSPLEALQRLRTDQFDVVVSDYRMAEMDGLEILQTLRDEHNNIPFIMFTGQGREEVAMKALNLGANYYLMKGNDLRSTFGELAHYIRQLLEQQKAQQELRQSEEKFRDLIENIDEIVYIVDKEGHIAYSSPRIKSLLGYDPLEIMGRPISDFLHPEDRPKALKRIQRILNGQVTRSEHRILTKSGEVRWVTTSSKPIFEEGGFVGLRGIMTDITDRKQAEYSLFKHARVELPLSDCYDSRTS